MTKQNQDKKNISFSKYRTHQLVEVCQKKEALFSSQQFKMCEEENDSSPCHIHLGVLLSH